MEIAEMWKKPVFPVTENSGIEHAAWLMRECYVQGVVVIELHHGLKVS